MASRRRRNTPTVPPNKAKLPRPADASVPGKATLEVVDDKATYAFINVAYTKSNENLFLALISGLSAFGLVAQTAFDSPLKQSQWQRVGEAMSKCQGSFHDLSSVEHLNMPFELGMAVGISLSREHRWYVLDTELGRAEKVLSDIKGAQIHIHDGTPKSILRAVKDALARDDMPELDEMMEIYSSLRSVADRLLSVDGYTSLFAPGPYRLLNQKAYKMMRKSLSPPRR